MRIAVDAMGGDFGPPVVVPGALQAAAELDVDVLLVGVEHLIRREFERLGGPSSRVTIIDAPEAIGMGEGLLAFRRKRRSSIRAAAELVKRREADAVVSMGNTAAVVTISRQVLGALDGVERPALALLVPNAKGLTLLIDVGANASSTAHHLLQFAVMGKIFITTALGMADPRIGLMSIGEEKSKGNDLVREAFELLRQAPLNFVGNVEGKDIYSGAADVVVSDGFTGNVALKVSEGLVESLFSMARREIMKDFFAKLGFLLMKRHIKRIIKRMDYAEYGGAHLLGLKGVCIIGHGRSNATAVKNAIRQGREFVRGSLQERIQTEILRFEDVLRGANMP